MAPNVHLVIKHNNIILTPQKKHGEKNRRWPPSVFPLYPSAKIFGNHHFNFFT